MNEGYVSYPEYRESGAKWLGKVPSHWNVYPTKRLFRLVAEPAKRNNSHELLSVYTAIGVAPRKDLEQKGNKCSSTDGYWLVKKDDIIVNKLLAWMGAIGHSSYDGVTSPAYDILRRTKSFNPRFYHYLFRNEIAQQEFKRWSRGIMEMRLRLYFEELGRISIPFPPKEEIEKITAFLDYETGKIDELIEKQQELIALLKEKRQAVISHAVTKGLDPTNPLKPSGIEWLGDVPEHWELKFLRHLGKCQNGINIGAEAFGSGYPFVSYGDAYRDRTLPATGSGLVNSTLEDRQQYSVLKGDTLFTRTSETIEEIGFSSTCLQSIPEATFAGFLIRFRPSEETVLADFTKHYFGNSLLRAFFIKEMNLITRASLSQDLLKRLPVLLPPSTEQREIADYLDKKERIFDKLSANAETQITLLRERRTALISAAVTGKIDVRDWQEPASPPTKSRTKRSTDLQSAH